MTEAKIKQEKKVAAEAASTEKESLVLLFNSIIHQYGILHLNPSIEILWHTVTPIENIIGEIPVFSIIKDAQLMSAEKNGIRTPAMTEETGKSQAH